VDAVDVVIFGKEVQPGDQDVAVSVIQIVAPASPTTTSATMERLLTLLSGSLSTGGFTGSLLGTGHCEVSKGDLKVKRWK